MPSRIVREGILTSEPVNACSWPAEVLYRRLMSVVDDFGRYYAKPALIRAACYPLLLEKVSDSDIGKWLTECVNAGLVRVYPASDGKRYLEIEKFGQARAKKSRFPEACEQPCTDENKCAQTCAHSPVFEFESVSVSVFEKHAAAPLGVQEENWSAWVKQKGKKQTAAADRLQRKHLAEWAEQGHDVNRIVEDAVAGHWAGLHPPARRQEIRRKSTLDAVIGAKDDGRIIEGVASEVGVEAVLPAPRDLRQQGGPDVEGRGSK